VRLSTHEYLYKLLTLYELFISSIMGPGCYTLPQETFSSWSCHFKLQVIQNSRFHFQNLQYMKCFWLYMLLRQNSNNKAQFSQGGWIGPKPLP
jgi:hypothetical protein